MNNGYIYIRSASSNEILKFNFKQSLGGVFNIERIKY